MSAITRRSMRERLQLRVPQQKMGEFCQRKGYGNFQTMRPSSRFDWIQADDKEILLGYNAEMRGLANYYALAQGAKEGLRKLLFVAEGSFLATLANKHSSSITKELAKHRQGKDIVVLAKTKEGKQKRYTLFKIRDWTPPKPKEDVDVMQSIIHLKHGTSTLQQRLNANICESCEKEGGFFEVHHVRKLKDLRGQKPWEKAMIARQRKTMVLCIECHDLLHLGILSNRQKKY